MIRIFVLLAIVLTTAAAIACQPGSIRTVTRISRFCAQGTPNTLEVEVQFAGCLSSSCDTLESAECTLQESEGVVTIEGVAEIHSKGEVCTTDCGRAIVDCSLELPPGNYTLQYADLSVGLTLPTNEERCSDQE